VDNGCSDATSSFLASCRWRALEDVCDRKTFGISAARNIAIRNAWGRFLIFVSDDLIVPENFIDSHVETLEEFKGYWLWEVSTTHFAD